MAYDPIVMRYLKVENLVQHDKERNVWTLNKNGLFKKADIEGDLEAEGKEEAIREAVAAYHGLNINNEIDCDNLVVGQEVRRILSFPESQRAVDVVAIGSKGTHFLEAKGRHPLDAKGQIVSTIDASHGKFGDVVAQNQATTVIVSNTISDVTVHPENEDIAVLANTNPYAGAINWYKQQPVYLMFTKLSEDGEFVSISNKCTRAGVYVMKWPEGKDEKGRFVFKEVTFNASTGDVIE